MEEEAPPGCREEEELRVEERAEPGWTGLGLFRLAAASVVGLGGVLAEPLLGEATQDRAQARRPAATVFETVQTLKDRVKATLAKKEEYNVEAQYWETGWAQALAKNETFTNLTLFVIFLNTVWIAYDTDNNDASLLINAKPIFQVVENLFCAYFTVEILARFLSFRNKWDAWRDGWFVFDFSLVFLMVWENWIMTLMVMASGTSEEGGPMQNTSILRALRLLRLLRASRVFRILRQFPELMILVQAMMAAMRAVCSTMALLLIIIYVFSILFTQLFQGSDAEVKKGCFENVPQSMNCLLKNGVFSGQMQVSDGTLDAGLVYYLIMIAYLSLACLSVMNLLIGILCEVVTNVAQAEKEHMAANDVKNKLGEVMRGIDRDGDNLITESEFHMLVEQPQACQTLDSIGVDVVALADFGDFLFHEKHTLTLSEFTDTVMLFCTEKQATAKDVIEIRKLVMRETQALEHRLCKVMQETIS